MTSYRIARRSFLAGVGGAFGLKILLRTLEARAQGAPPPPRFLMMHWPVGTVRTQFRPTGVGTSYTTSKLGQGPGWIVSPFDTPELRPHTIVLHGMSFMGVSGQGGGHENGTVFCTTGSHSPGTRQNGGETDDSVAGGPSWDQILLRNVPALSRRDASGQIIGRGYYNVICDARVDSNETSTRCLSYGYTKQTIASARPGGMISENIPLPRALKPLDAYNDLFSGFMPGGGGQSQADATARLAAGKSVLDGSTAELARLSALAPASERATIDAHAQVIRQLEEELEEVIDPPLATGCSPPAAPPSTLTGKTADRLNDYGNPVSIRDDGPLLEEVGQAHAAVLRGAFACDLIRVATFQWAPGTNHVAFSGLDPNSNTIYMHHPLSHRNGSAAFYDGPRPTSDAYIWDAMVNANRWYLQKTAALVDQFRTQVDPLDPQGGSLLDRTVIPVVTEVANPAHSTNGLAALICGGRSLGMQGGQYQPVTGSHSRFWVTIAQAYLGANPLGALASETFFKSGVTVIPGLWVPPA
jgi:hypothetical protein